MLNENYKTTYNIIIYLNVCIVGLAGFQPVITTLWASSDTGSYFGFSVQLSKSGVFVGAPKYNNGGAVFVCAYKNCKQISLVTETSDKYISHISDQWLGITLNVYNNILVACAPKWINKKFNYYYFSNGLCHVYNTETNKSEILIPFLNKNNQGYTDRNKKTYFYYAFGQAGFSIDISNDGTLTLGAPGLLRWLGSFAKYNLNDTDELPFAPKPMNFYSDIVGYDIQELLPEPEYFGYAVASGKFRDGTIMNVIGAPRSNGMIGQVFLYEDALPDSITILHKLTGRELGEYFGAVITVGDVNGDGFDDILVGAPMYSGRSIEVGCIYVFISEEHGFYKQIIEANRFRGQYGSAISIIGDINQDGYNDVAVGAPYEEETGAVYVLLGSKDGLGERPYYRILGLPTNLGFGISISRGIQNNHTGVTDIIVGAHKSSEVVMVHFRPIIRVFAFLTSSEIKISMEKVISENFTFSVCSCLRFTAKYISNKEFSFNTTLITDPHYGRVSVEKSNDIIKCKNNQVCCKNYTVIVIHNPEPNHQIYTGPFEFRYEYNIFVNEKNLPEIPEISYNNPTAEILFVPFEINCGDDEICQPEIILKAEWMARKEAYVIGSSDDIDVEVTIENLGENAYSCLLLVKHDIPLMRMPERCIQTIQGYLQCNIGNPLKSNAKRVLILQFDPGLVEELQRAINIELNITSIGHEKELENNVQNLKIGIEREHNIYINSLSDPDQYPLNFTDANITEIIQRYTIRNQGPSLINVFIFILSIPTTLLYRSSKIDISGTDIANGVTKPTYCDCNLLTLHDNYFNMLTTYCKSNSSLSCHWTSYKTAHHKCENGIDGCEQHFCACSGKNVKYVSLRITMLVDVNLIKENLVQENNEILSFTTNVMPLVKNNIKENCLDAVTVFVGEEIIPDVLPWIIIGIAIGILILFILTIVLWKIGFFKRMVLPTPEEREGIFDEDESNAEECEFENQN